MDRLIERRTHPTLAQVDPFSTADDIWDDYTSRGKAPFTTMSITLLYPKWVNRWLPASETSWLQTADRTSPMQDELVLARGAAARLSARYGERLPIDLEKIIAGGGKPDVRQFSIGDTMAIASFVLSVAQFLYTIYKDRAEATADRGKLKREIRSTVLAPPKLTLQQKSDVIEAAVEEASSYDA